MIKNAKQLEKQIAELERYPLAVLSAVLTYITPIPSAYLVGTAVHTDLEWHLSIAIITAVAIELLGIVTVSNALSLWRWNKNNTRKKDEHAPIALAIASVIAYLTIVIVLTVMLDTMPTLKHYAAAMFPFLAILSALAFVIRLEQSDRVDARESETEETSMKKREAAVNRKQTALNAREETLKVREAAMNRNEATFDSREAAIADREAAVKNAEPLLAEIEARETAVTILETSMKRLNPLAQEVIYMIGGSGDTGSAIAKRHGKSPAYVSGIKTSLNGAG